MLNYFEALGLTNGFYQLPLSFLVSCPAKSQLRINIILTKISATIVWSYNADHLIQTPYSDQHVKYYMPGGLPLISDAHTCTTSSKFLLHVVIVTVINWFGAFVSL